MERTKATDVRKNWSMVCDNVIRRRPEFIRRVRDELLLISKDDVLHMLDSYEYCARVFDEKDGTVTLSLDNIDIAENAESLDAAKAKMAASILEYAEEYYENYSAYSNSPNRKMHIPYVLKALIMNDTTMIERAIVCQNGKN